MNITDMSFADYVEYQANRCCEEGRQLLTVKVNPNLFDKIKNKYAGQANKPITSELLVENDFVRFITTRGPVSVEAGPNLSPLTPYQITLITSETNYFAFKKIN